MNDMGVQRIPRKGNGETLLLACGALAREVIEFVERNRWSCFTVQCLPAKLHWQPHRIPEAVRSMIRQLRDRHDQIHVLYGDFGRYIRIAAETGGTSG